MLTCLLTLYEMYERHIVAVQKRLFPLKSPYFPLLGRKIILLFSPGKRKKPSLNTPIELSLMDGADAFIYELRSLASAL